MIRYLLDTNICIYIIKQHPKQVIEHLRTLLVGDVAISVITLAELEYGAAKSSRPEQNREALIAFTAPLEVLPFDDNASLHYGEIRAELENAEQKRNKALVLKLRPPKKCSKYIPEEV